MPNIFNMTDLWNSVGTTFNAIKMNVTNTASAVSSRLMDLQVAGVSQFAVDPSGSITAGSPTGGMVGAGRINAKGFFKDGVELVSGSSGIPEPPNDGVIYGRRTLTGTSTWQPAPSGGGGTTVTIADTPPGSPSPGNLWWESDTGQLFISYNDGDTTQWVSATSGAGTVPAAPIDALAYNGMQINGSMEVSQENGTTVRNVNGYIVDGWRISTINVGFSVQQITDAPAGYTKSIKVAITTPNAAPAVGDLAIFQQQIEGLRVARCAFGTAAASSVSVGFWVKANRTGTYTASLRNGTTPNRSCLVTFTVNTSGVWEYKAVTFPGDATGAWLSDTGIGFRFSVAMMGGTNFSSSPAGTWLAGDFIALTGQTNGVAASSDYMQITGVVVLPGVALPNAAQAPLIMRPYDQELLLAQRYWWASNLATPKGSGTGSLIGVGITTSVINGAIRCTLPMRVALSTSNATLWFNGIQNQMRNSATGVTVAAVPTIFVGGLSSQGYSQIGFSGTPTTVGAWYDFDLQVDARL